MLPERQPVVHVQLANGRLLELDLVDEVLELHQRGEDAVLLVPVASLPDLAEGISRAQSEATWRAAQASAPKCPRCGDGPATHDDGKGNGRKVCFDCLHDLMLLEQDDRPDLKERR